MDKNETYKIGIIKNVEPWGG